MLDFQRENQQRCTKDLTPKAASLMMNLFLPFYKTLCIIATASKSFPDYWICTLLCRGENAVI